MLFNKRLCLALGSKNIGWGQIPPKNHQNKIKNHQPFTLKFYIQLVGVRKFYIEPSIGKWIRGEF